MVLPILVLPAEHWHGLDAPRPVERSRPGDLYRSGRRLRTGPRWREMSHQRYRSALLRHWTSTAAQWAPSPLSPLNVANRTSAGCRTLLAQCEALLRQLLRRRRVTLGLSRRDLVQIATGFDGATLHAPVSSAAATAFVLVSMYWHGCSHPLSLFAEPLHPPTGLVRWLTGFTVKDQVEHGVLLLTRLAQEEQRMFEFALRLTTRIDALTANRARGPVLLPELLKVAELTNAGQRDGITTVEHQESRTYVTGAHAPKSVLA